MCEVMIFYRSEVIIGVVRIKNKRQMREIVREIGCRVHMPMEFNDVRLKAPYAIYKEMPRFFDVRDINGLRQNSGFGIKRIRNPAAKKMNCLAKSASLCVSVGQSRDRGTGGLAKIMLWYNDCNFHLGAAIEDSVGQIIIYMLENQT